MWFVIIDFSLNSMVFVSLLSVSVKHARPHGLGIFSCLLWGPISMSITSSLLNVLKSYKLTFSLLNDMIVGVF